MVGSRSPARGERLGLFQLTLGVSEPVVELGDLGVHLGKLNTAVGSVPLGRLQGAVHLVKELVDLFGLIAATGRTELGAINHRGTLSGVSGDAGVSAAGSYP